MIPRLTDDPAWVRYEWELRYLPLIAMLRTLQDAAQQLGDALAPSVRQLGDAIAKAAQHDGFRKLVAFLEQT